MKKTSLILALILSCFAISLQAATEIPSSNEVKISKNKNVTPLCLAISKGDVDGVKKLIELGVDIEKKSNGLEPIHYAARYNQVEIMKALVEGGANIHSKCDKGHTALDYAKLSNATDAIQYIKSVK
ncbi:MAG: hypothetical protein CL596_06620 [Alteromonas sp.]|nr:hypothetical protein [Alteromonas sp.]MAY23365.1 hypothetical protein [Flavobacteriaceae bacterium]|tara:strand:- start:11390 stop:11770 length:381 start_codon:yes stop_codon:yes gene_type:complete